MEKYEHDLICKRCGNSYGDHRWSDDACPEVDAKTGLQVGFMKGTEFIPAPGSADTAADKAQGYPCPPYIGKLII